MPAPSLFATPAPLLRLLATLALALVLIVPRPAAAQDAAIEETISRQLEAFNARDVDTAFDFASPMIQGLFGSAQNFGLMVQQGYPMVWTNDDVRFLELRELRGALYQKVMIRDAQGALHVLDYRMIETPEGWRIDGVDFLPAPDVGV